MASVRHPADPPVEKHLQCRSAPEGGDKLTFTVRVTCHVGQSALSCYTTWRLLKARQLHYQIGWRQRLSAQTAFPKKNP